MISRSAPLASRWLFLMSFVLTLTVSAVAQSSFVHPGLPFTTADISQLKANLRSEPWASAFPAFANASHSSLGYGQQGPHAIVGRAPNVNLTQFNNDMRAIHNLTWMWVFTGNPAYAQKATDLLDAWAVTNTRWTGDETFLALGDAAEHFITAADILKSLYPGWTQANTDHVNHWFAHVLWPEADVPNPVRGANQGAIQLKLALGLAAFLDDATKWQQAISVLRKDAAGGLANSLPNGEVGDSGRDEGHWAGQLIALSWCAEVAWKQGVDVFADLDNRLLVANELYSRFQLDSASATYVPFGGGYAYWWGGFGGPWNARRGMYTHNIIENAYVRRKGLAAPYTLQLREQIGQSFEHLLFRKTADTSTATPLPAIAHPATVPVTSLTRNDVGDAGLIGSASYASGTGTWTLQGAGTGIPVPPLGAPDGFSYAFQSISGDATIVTRVTSLQGIASQAGVMIRESFAADAKYVGLLVNPINGVAATWRGATAWNKTNISWNEVPGGFQTHGGPAIPWWLKLERLGTRLYAYHSGDGINWTCISTVEISLPATAYLGLCVSSGDTSALTTATFANVALTNPAPAGSPVITSATAANATRGTAFNYNVNATNTPTSFAATGLPAGLSIDANTGVISGVPTTPGTAFVTLQATNAPGTGQALLVLTVANDVVPAAPTGLVAAGVEGTEVALAWNAAEHATSYAVKRASSAGGPYTTIVSGVSGTAFVDASPYPGFNYYVVTAFSGALEGAASTETAIQLPPAIPAGAPTAINGNGQVSLTWPASVGAASYRVKRALVSGGPYATIASDLTSPSYTDTDVANGTLYYYVVSAVFGALESANSAEALGVPGATSATWSATAASGAWSTASNWESGVPPASPTFLSFGASAITALNNDLPDLKVARLSFSSGSPGYTIAGNALTLGDAIANQSSTRQAINTPLVLTGPTAINVTGNSLDLRGVLSGTGGLVKRGPHELKLTGVNTYSGGTIIRDSVGGWPPSAPLSVEGNGTGVLGAPTSGPLGTGPVVLDGGALMNTAPATLYNDIVIADGTKSFLYNFSGAFVLAGRLLGGGTVTYDGTTSSGGLIMSGDNREFTGTFVLINRSSNQRLHFTTPNAGSAKAHWVFDSTFTDTPRLSYSGMMPIGAMSGGGAMRSFNTAGFTVGALNLDTEFSGNMTGHVAIDKVGTGILRFSGINTNSGPTTVTAGTFLLNGTYATDVTANGGTFGGVGNTTGPVTVNSGATFAPGDQGIGTFTTSQAFSLNVGATFAAEVNTTTTAADRVSAGNVSLSNATLTLTDLNPGALPLGTAFRLINNTGTAPVAGTFNGLPELGLATVGGHAFRITYRGGDGNDVVLHDDRTTALPTALASLAATPVDGEQIDLTWTPAPEEQFVTGYSVKRATAAGGPYVTVAANISGAAFSDTGLTYTTPYFYVVFATNYVGAGPDSAEVSATTLALTAPPAPVQLIAVAGSTRVDLSWAPAKTATTYHVKRALASGGPYTTIATVTGTNFSDTGLTDGTTYYYVVSAENAAGESVATAETNATPAVGAYAYWPFNEATGTNAADIWGARNATLSSTATFVPGANGNAVKLTGASGSIVTLPAGVVSTLTDFTISAWVKLDAAANWARLFDFGSGQTSYMFLAPRHGNAGNTVRFEIFRNNIGQRIDSSFALTTGTWVHLAVTRAGNTGILYINGAEAGRHTAMSHTPASLGNTALNRIGQSQFNDPFLNGAVDDFRIYSRALAPAEIDGAYRAIAPPSPSLVISTASGNVDLSWTPLAGATSYFIKRASSAAGPFTTIASGVTGTAFTDVFAPGGSSTYIVSARVGAFESAPSNAVTVVLPPAAPRGLVAGAWNGRIDLSWTPVTGAATYEVRRALSSDGPFTTVASVAVPSYSDTSVVNGTTYYYSVAATNSAGTALGSATVSATPVARAELDAWTHGDVGSVGLAGNAGYSNGTYTVQGSGADIWFQADGFHFVHQPLNGDGAIMARIVSQQNSSGIAKAGVMMRENLNTNSRHATMDHTPNNAMEFIWRTASNVNAAATTTSGAPLARWVRLVRSGNSFTAYHSADGLPTWAMLGTAQTIAMGASARVGLVVSAGNNGVLGQATFDHVNIATAAPVVFSSATASGVVGVPFNYTITVNNSAALYTATGLPSGLSLNVDTGEISGTPTTAGVFTVNVGAINAMGAGSTALTLTIDTPDAAFNAWAANLPAGTRFADADPDGDGIANLVEFVTGLDGMTAQASAGVVGVVEIAGVRYPTFTYQRRLAIGGARLAVTVSANLDVVVNLGAVELSAAPATPGFESVVVRSAVPFSGEPRQFFRLVASLPTD
jgi:autotransporter-associated beta strand protein